MIADYDKYNHCLDHADKFSLKPFFASRKVWFPAKLYYMFSWKFFPSIVNLPRVIKAEDIDPIRDRTATSWYHWGTDKACDALTHNGFKIIERDMEVVARDPVIHFVKL